MKISDLQGEIKVAGGETIVNNPTQTTSEKPKNTYTKIGDTLSNFSQGVAKGELSTLKGLGTIGQTALDQTVGRVTNAIQGKGFTPTGAGDFGNDTYRKGTEKEQKARQTLTPEGAAQKIGFGAEQLAEYFIPAAKAAKAENAINIISTGIKNPALAAGARILGKSVIQGVAAGGINLAQTGGDLKQAKNTALTAGAIRGGFATIGEGARAIRLPERLYSTIFKNTADDMMGELKTETLVKLQETNPQKFQSFVDRGLVKVGVSGKVEVDPTVAKQALDMGLKGSIRKMTKTVIEGTLESEAKVQDAVKNYKGTVDLSEKQFYNVLKSLSDEYQDVGFGEISDEAGRLANAIKDGSGKISAENALAVRRLLDRARVASSFDKPVSKLSLTQGNLKTLADAARSRVNAIPGVGDVMKNYSFYIDALDTLAKEAARRGNNQAISLIDALFLSSSFGVNSQMAGLSGYFFRKWINSGPGMTFLGQLMNKGVASPLTIGATSGVSKSLQSLSEPQQ